MATRISAAGSDGPQSDCGRVWAGLASSAREPSGALPDPTESPGAASSCWSFGVCTDGGDDAAPAWPDCESCCTCCMTCCGSCCSPWATPCSGCAIRPRWRPAGRRPCLGHLPAPLLRPARWLRRSRLLGHTAGRPCATTRRSCCPTSRWFAGCHRARQGHQPRPCRPRRRLSRDCSERLLLPAPQIPSAVTVPSQLRRGSGRRTVHRRSVHTAGRRLWSVQLPCRADHQF